jgi:hypothetical protein
MPPIDVKKEITIPTSGGTHTAVSTPEAEKVIVAFEFWGWSICDVEEIGLLAIRRMSQSCDRSRSPTPGIRKRHEFYQLRVTIVSPLPRPCQAFSYQVVGWLKTGNVLT